jgi:membrane protease YdiL (CAAX protease family)
MHLMSNKVEPAVITHDNRWLSSQRLKAIITLAIGIFLWFLPTLLVPNLSGPVVVLIDATLHVVGLLSASAGSFERGFIAALVVRWLAVILLLLFVVGVQRASPSSLGIRIPRWRDVLLALGIGGLALVVGTALYLLVNGGSQTDASTYTGQILRTLGLAGRIHLDVNAAVVEELFFRGLLIECLVCIFGRRWLAGVVSFALFVGSHYLSGSASLAQTLTADAVGGLALVSLYLLRRNVLLCMLAHAVMDVVVVFA